jgi:hypothetical protein
VRSNRGTQMTWRQRVLGWWVLLVIAALVIGVLFGLVWALITALGARSSDSADDSTASPAASAPSANTATDPQQRARDELAQAPMAQVPAAAARPQGMAAQDAQPLNVPGAPEDEATTARLPRTPEGALATLAALDRTALSQPSPIEARRLHDAMSLPGAVPTQSWTPFMALENLLETASATSDDPDFTVTYTPTHGLIKGSLDDGDFAVVCVLGILDVSYQATTSTGLGDCQRMQWSEQGWRLAPGSQPAWAPNTWPGSADSVAAGWRPLTYSNGGA